MIRKWRLNWAASWRNSPKIILDGRKWENLRSIETIVRKRNVPLYISHRYKRIRYLKSRMLWIVIEIYYLCLASKVQKGSQHNKNLLCYPFLLTNEILSLLVWKLNSPVQNQVFLWNLFLLAEQQVLIPIWKHTKLLKPKVFPQWTVCSPRQIRKLRTSYFHCLWQ